MKDSCGSCGKSAACWFYDDGETYFAMCLDCMIDFNVKRFASNYLGVSHV